MSSTGRGKKKKEKNENYPTPAWCTRRFLDRLRYRQHLLFLPEDPSLTTRWLEPCAGEGNIVRAVNSSIAPYHVLWTTVEIREECERVLPTLTSGPFYCPQDFLKWEYDGPKFRVAITNPPFSLAFPILKRCLEIAHYVVIFQRLNFLGSGDRVDFFHDRMPNHTFVLPNRAKMGLNEKGKLAADSIEYAWFVWDSANPVSIGTIEVLDDTPLAERQADEQKVLRIIKGQTAPRSLL